MINPPPFTYSISVPIVEALKLAKRTSLKKNSSAELAEGQAFP